MFHILSYFKSWNYNTNVLVRIIVPCLNRCELKFKFQKFESFIYYKGKF